jgi:hypothetical protein
MKTESQLEKETRRIADAIVELVKRTDGPVTLARVEREVPGFAKHDAPSWGHVLTSPKREISFWNGMTEAGLAALIKVISERRVAIQYVNLLLYMLEDCMIADENWQPIVLLPATAANLDTPNWLMRAPDSIARAISNANVDNRLLTPCYAGATADGFFGANTVGY